jgi:hypothetical protein
MENEKVDIGIGRKFAAPITADGADGDRTKFLSVRLRRSMMAFLMTFPMAPWAWPARSDAAASAMASLIEARVERDGSP